MFEPSHSILVGLEIGTHKVCAMVGEVSPDGGLNMIGVGQALSHGVRKGEVLDAEKAEEDVRTAIVEAENMANVEIRSVCLGITGAHIRGVNNRGVHPVVSVGRTITKEDADDAVRNARTFSLPGETTVLHSIRQHFCLDGKPGIENPVGHYGSRLEVDVHVIFGLKNRLLNAVRIVENLQLNVEEMAFCGLASSLAVLSHEQKQLGALVIDMGAGTTDYTVFCDGVLRHSGLLAVGGDHITNDLYTGLKVPISRAEKLKKEHGAAFVDEKSMGQTVTSTSESGTTLSSVNLGQLQRIMHLRLEEIFHIIAEDLENHDLLHRLRAGVCLCGGGVWVPGIEQLAAHVFGLPARIATSTAVSGLNETLLRPEFATTVGLVKYRAIREAQKSQAPRPSMRSVFTSTFRNLLRFG